LSVYLGLGSYVFQGTSVEDERTIEEYIPYGEELEGYWNYVYWGYAKGEARGFILFQERVGKLILNILHQRIVESIHFIVGEDPSFNG
jgi:hypothetical protein